MLFVFSIFLVLFCVYFSFVGVRDERIKLFGFYPIHCIWNQLHGLGHHAIFLVKVLSFFCLFQLY